MTADLTGVCERFRLAGPVVDISSHPGGHIHVGWVVTCGREGAVARYLLQHLNTSVFPAPAALMANIELVTEHLRAAGEVRSLAVVRTQAGGSHWVDGGGRAWRLYDYLEGAHSASTVGSAAEAEQIGRAFGRFHRLLADLDPGRLRPALARLHDPERRYRQLQEVATRDPVGRARSVRRELGTVRDHADLLEDEMHEMGMEAPDVPRRVVHGDAKADNALVDDRSGTAVCVVDLDTVMPGSVLWDVGDMVRSATCPVPEDSPDPAAAVMDLDRLAALMDGWLGQTGGLLTDAERSRLGRAGPVVTYEQALRFLADHLAGDVYYRTARPDHNLDRCRVQLHLLESMRSQQPQATAMLAIPAPPAAPSNAPVAAAPLNAPVAGDADRRGARSSPGREP